MRIGLRTIARGILHFWAAWFTLVTLTNACDALKAMGVLPDTWRLASGNFVFVTSATAGYGTPKVVVAILFGGVILWEALAAALFWRAARRSATPGAAADEAAHTAFGVGIALWCAFALADELFIVYAVSGTHIGLFVAQLASLLFLVCAPGARGDDA
jgi:hypothetical protein